MKIEITENQINNLHNCYGESFISEQFDRFQCLTKIMDKKIDIFTDAEWKDINIFSGVKPYTEFSHRVKLKEYIDKIAFT